VGVVQVVIRTGMEGAPPGPEAAGAVAQRVIGVKDDSVHTVVAALEEVCI